MRFRKSDRIQSKISPSSKPITRRGRRGRPTDTERSARTVRTWDGRRVRSRRSVRSAGRTKLTAVPTRAASDGDPRHPRARPDVRSLRSVRSRAGRRPLARRRWRPIHTRYRCTRFASPLRGWWGAFLPECVPCWFREGKWDGGRDAVPRGPHADRGAEPGRRRSSTQSSSMGSRP